MLIYAMIHMCRVVPVHAIDDVHYLPRSHYVLILKCFKAYTVRTVKAYHQQ